MMRLWTLLLLLLLTAPASATTYFAVGTGNWSATSTWSLTSGGATGVGPPGVGDIAKLDGNTGTVTLDGNVTVQSVLSDTGATLATTTLNLSNRTLTIDTGTLNNGTPTFADAFTIVPGTSTVICNGGSIAPHGQPLYDISITGSCNFGRVESAHDVTIAAGATLNLEACCSPARYYAFNSLIGTAGTTFGTWNPGGLAPRLIATQQVNITGFTVTGINCQGTVPCLADATSTDGGGNTNWCFGAGCSNATYTPTVTPTETPTVTPTTTPTTPEPHCAPVVCNTPDACDSATCFGTNNPELPFVPSDYASPSALQTAVDGILGPGAITVGGYVNGAYCTTSDLIGECPTPPPTPTPGVRKHGFSGGAVVNVQ